MTSMMRKIGLMVIILGSFFLLNRLNVFIGDVEVLAVSMFLAFAYIGMGHKHYGSVGFLIPSAILGLIYFAENYLVVWFPHNDSMIMIVMIGAAFILVYFLHTMRFSGFAQKFWSLITGGVIVLFGLLVGILEHFNVEGMNDILNIVVACGLIVAGLLLIFFKNRQERQ